jgi:hypothetical protein
MRVNAINLKWDDVKGEGVVKTLSYFDTAHYVTKLDLLQDCIYDLQNLYDEIILADKNILQRPVKTFSGGEPNYVTMPEISREDIIRMAREADPGFDGSANSDGTMLDCIVGLAAIKRFAVLIAAHEREECIAIAESKRHSPNFVLASIPSQNGTAVDIANLIRERGKK